MMFRIICQSAIISLTICLAVPLIGLLIHGIFTFILQRMLSIIDKTGTLYLIIGNVITFPGVIIHELSHALFALITGAKVNKVRLYGIKGDSLGNVNFTPRGFKISKAIQLALASCAPVISGVITETVILYVFKTHQMQPWQTAILIYLIISILMHMDMSSSDISNYIKGMKVIFPVTFLITLSANIIGAYDLSISTLAGWLQRHSI